MKSLLFIPAALLLFSLKPAAQDTVSTNGQKFAVLEASTGAWTGWAPDGIVYLNNVKSSNPKTICLQHHHNDGMVNTQSSAFFSAFNVTGFPLGTVDRKLFSGQTDVVISRSVWNASVAAQIASSPTFDVTLIYSYNPSTRVISASVSGKALANLSGDYYTNLYIVEDSVTGTGSQYNQANFSDATTGHPFFGAGNPIVGFKHMNVVRDILGGVFGTPAFTNPATNTTATKNYNYTVPAGYNINNIRLVATVAKYGTTINDHEIQNAVEGGAGVSCSYAQPQVQICVVTTDTTSGKNLIVWEKSGIKHAKEYKIYRETSTPGTYQHIGTKASNLFSTYEDAGSNPQSQSYRYKITVVDSCNRETPLSQSTMHQTVHVSFNVLTNNTVYISWVPYVGRSYTTYTIKRNNNSGPFVQIAQISSNDTSYSDVAPPSGVNVYRVEIQVPGGCAPSAKTTAYNTIISNAATAWHTGISGINETIGLTIHPNPASSSVTIAGINTKYPVDVLDITGRKLGMYNVDAGKTALTIDVTKLEPGIYIIRTVTADGITQSSRFQKL